MFVSFIYVIVALLVYTAYQPPEHHADGFGETVFLFAVLWTLFFLMTRMSFRLLAGRAEEARGDDPSCLLDQQFERVVSRQSILAILLFAYAIHGLNLPYYFRNTIIFQPVPTLGDLLFILVFVYLLVLTWSEAYTAHRAIYRTDIRRAAYVRSRSSFSLPVLIPWLVLSLLLDLIQLLPFGWPGEFLATTFGEILFFLAMLVLIAVPAPLLIKKIWGCEPLEEGFFRSRIEEFCRKAGVRYADILNWPLFGGRMVTAGVMGLTGKFRYILVTPALLDILDPDEVDAVIAHEIGHVKKRHLWLYLFFFAGFMVLMYGAFNGLLYLILLNEPLYRFVDALVSGDARISPNLAMLTVTAMLFWIYFRYIFGFFMRNFERQADIYALRLVGAAGPLVRTFQKIVLTSGQAAEKPNWHHFSIRERIHYLSACEADGRWMIRHDRKVRRAIVLYFGALLLIGLPGFYLNAGEHSRLLNSKALENLMFREIEKHPEDFRLHAMLGDLFQNRERWEEAAAAYERALALNRENAHVLNNYAWMLATTENALIRNPVKALEMARRAASLEPSAHIWDTLAEALYVNGHVAEAVAAGAKALEAAEENKAYYPKQLAKFRSAADAF